MLSHSAPCCIPRLAKGLSTATALRALKFHETHTVVSVNRENVYYMSLAMRIRHTYTADCSLCRCRNVPAQPCGHAVPSLFRDWLLPLRHQTCRSVVTQRNTGGKTIYHRSAVTHMSVFCKVPLAGCRLKQLLRVHRRSQLGPNSQTALRSLLVSCRAYSDQAGVASTCCTRFGGCSPTLHFKSFRS